MYSISVFFYFLCLVWFVSSEDSYVDWCQAHTTARATWLTLRWLQSHVTSATSPAQPKASEGCAELNLCYLDELTIEIFSDLVITKYFGHGDIFSALRHAFVSIGGFHLESWGSLLFLTLFSLTQIRSATPLQIHFPNFSCLRRAPSAQGW